MLTVNLHRKLRDTFPGTALMYRTTTQPGERRSEKDDEMIAVFQINQSARTVMNLLKVPLFHCKSKYRPLFSSHPPSRISTLMDFCVSGSELIKGSHSYKDFVHYETDCKAFLHVFNYSMC